MIFASMLLLVLPALALEDARETQVDITKLKNVIIEGFNGTIDAQRVELLRNTEHLRILFSNITSLHLDLCHDLPQLKSLRIRSNVLSGDVNLNFNSCSDQLEVFRLWQSENFNAQELLTQLGNIKSLQHLQLNDQNIPILKENLLNNPNLETLTIESSGLATVEDNALKNLPKLYYLSLRNNKIGWINKEVYAPLTNLKEINLEGNRFIMLTTEMFPALPNLERMNFGFNTLKEINLDGIKNLAPKLKYVDIGGFDQKGEEIKSGGVQLKGIVFRTHYYHFLR